MINRTDDSHGLGSSRTPYSSDLVLKVFRHGHTEHDRVTETTVQLISMNNGMVRWRPVMTLAGCTFTPSHVNICLHDSPYESTMTDIPSNPHRRNTTVSDKSPGIPKYPTITRVSAARPDVCKRCIHCHHRSLEVPLSSIPIPTNKTPFPCL